MYIGRVRETHRPVLITQNGHAASYLVDAESMDNLFDAIDLTRDIETSRREFADGKGIPHEQVMPDSLELLDKLASKCKRNTI